MKPIHIGFVLIALCCVVGVSMADTSIDVSATQSISADPPVYSASITAPITIDDWVLTRGGNNDKYIGTVVISSDAPNDWDMVLTAIANTGSWLSNTDNPLSISTVYPGDETTWELFSTGELIPISPDDLKSPNNLATITSIPVYLRQLVTDQPSKTDPYTLVITYSLSVTEPTP